MEYTYIVLRAFAPLINLFVDILNIFIQRDKKIILFGAWMGYKFADNTRYLYEYLQKEIDKYDVDKMIWVTRDKETHDFLTSLGYEVYMMHDPKSYYYHLKAGVHIVCNLPFPVKGYNGDIMGQLSGHAIKINTWHGTPMKAGKSTGVNQYKQGIKGKLQYILRHNSVFYGLVTPGHWDKAYYLSTGKEGTKRCSAFCGVPKEQFIECGYPRNCKAERIHHDEQDVISMIKEGRTTILYVPTFRSDGSAPHPLLNKKLTEFLKESNMLWIEKPHAATTDMYTNDANNGNVLFLDSQFDINIIIPHIDYMVTDYSSACYDAMYFGKPVLFYIPDYLKYLSEDRGFLFDYKEMVEGLEAVSVIQLINLLKELQVGGEFTYKIGKKEFEIKQEIFSEQQKYMDGILDIISIKTGVLRKKIYELN